MRILVIVEKEPLACCLNCILVWSALRQYVVCIGSVGCMNLFAPRLYVFCVTRGCCWVSPHDLHEVKGWNSLRSELICSYPFVNDLIIAPSIKGLICLTSIRSCSSVWCWEISILELCSDVLAGSIQLSLRPQPPSFLLQRRCGQPNCRWQCIADWSSSVLLVTSRMDRFR